MFTEVVGIIWSTLSLPGFGIDSFFCLASGRNDCKHTYFSVVTNFWCLLVSSFRWFQNFTGLIALIWLWWEVFCENFRSHFIFGGVHEHWKDEIIPPKISACTASFSDKASFSYLVNAISPIFLLFFCWFFPACSTPPADVAWRTGGKQSQSQRKKKERMTQASPAAPSTPLTPGSTPGSTPHNPWYGCVHSGVLRRGGWSATVDCRVGCPRTCGLTF